MHNTEAVISFIYSFSKHKTKILEFIIYIYTQIHEYAVTYVNEITINLQWGHVFERDQGIFK